MNLAKRKFALFAVVYAVWLALTWPPDRQHLAAGVLVALLVVTVTGGLSVEKPLEAKRPLRWWYFAFFYLPMFLWECLKANVDVAYRVLHPALPIRPGIVRIRTNLKSDAGITFLANSITLTPGTMSVDVDRTKGILYIHWINVKEASDTEEATRIIAEKFERILLKIFD